MNKLILGFKFVLAHSLTRKEVEVMICFIINKKFTLGSLSNLLNTDKKALHKIIMTLRLKQLIEIAEKDSKGVHTYQIKGEK